MGKSKNAESKIAESSDEASGKSDSPKKKSDKEFGGPKGLEPTRYGDWERKGIVSDF